MTVVKIIELLGESETSWEDAAKSALDQAAKVHLVITVAISGLVQDYEGLRLYVLNRGVDYLVQCQSKR